MNAIRGFTSACGQSIYRGNKFPYDSRGAYLATRPSTSSGEPTSEYPDGKLMLRKAESEDEEFMRSSDFNSIHQYCDRTRRMPFVTDMYRASFRMPLGSTKATGSLPAAPE